MPATTDISHLPASLQFSLAYTRHYATPDQMDRITAAARSSRATDVPAAVDARKDAAADWLVRTYAPAWLDLAGMGAHAGRVRALTILNASTAVGVAEALTAVRDAVRSARDAAGSPAQVDATWDSDAIASDARLGATIGEIAGGYNGRDEFTRAVALAVLIGEDAAPVALLADRAVAMAGAATLQESATALVIALLTAD
jgi:hypothetical protein